MGGRRALRLIWCGLCRRDHTPAEWAACLAQGGGR